MKKKLLSILALLAMTVSGAWADDAKVVYALTEGDTFTSGQTVEVKNDAEAVVATITYGESGGADFKAAKADDHVTGYTAFTEGNGTNGNKEGGTFYTIVPVYDGTIDVAVVLNADKAFYVEEDGTALTDYNGITVDAKYYGTYSFKVSAGKSYKVYCAGSKLGFYGFEYTYTPSQSAPEDQPADDGVDYTLNVGTSEYGTVAFKNAAGEAITTAKEGQTVTVEITPAEGYVVDEVSGQWLAAVAAVRRANIGLLKDVELTKVEGADNQWTFEMQRANVKISATYKELTDKSALNTAISDAETYYNSISESYPEIAAELQTAINTAKEVQGNADATQTEVETATTTLNDAVSTAQAAVQAAEEQAAADQAAAKAAIDKINAIGTVEYTEDCKALIDAAREAYDALTDAQKDLVNEETLKVLTDAETAYAELKAAAEQAAADQAAAKAAIDKINAIGTVEYTEDCKALIDAAREAYDALTDAQKDLVNEETLKVLTDAEAEYKRLEDIATGIATVKADNKADVWYDLNGRRVLQPTKGIYVRNGKKVVIK